MTEIRSGDVERAMNSVGYSHGRHEDQAQRVRDFRQVVTGRNFITPRVAGLYRLKVKPYVIVEISLGDGIIDRDETMIGITVVDRARMENCHDLSTCVHSLDELKEAIAKLEEHFSSTGWPVEFIRSSFGGGWIIALNDEAADICRGIFEEEESPLAPIGGTSGWIVEPQDLADTIEALRAAGCVVTL